MSNMQHGGLLRCWAKFARPAPLLVRAYRHASQLMTSAPWQASPDAMLQGLLALSLPSALADLGSLCTSARWATIGATGALQKAWRACDAVAIHMAAALVPVVHGTWRREWHRPSSNKAMYRQEYADRAQVHEGPVTQTAVARLLRPCIEVGRHRLAEGLRRRAVRWDLTTPEATVLAFATERPPRIIFCCIACRTVCSVYQPSIRGRVAALQVPMWCCHRGLPTGLPPMRGGAGVRSTLLDGQRCALRSPAT